MGALKNCTQADALAQLVCLSRRCLVKRTPEEEVRQEFLSICFGSLGYSPHLVAVEVSLRSLCPNTYPPPPRRRIDVVCSYIDKGSLSPLLLVECKVKRPSRAALTQMRGYNFFLQAPFVALAWKGSIFVTRFNKVWYEGAMASMPSYQQIIESSKNLLL